MDERNWESKSLWNSSSNNIWMGEEKKKQENLFLFHIEFMFIYKYILIYYYLYWGVKYKARRPLLAS